MHVMRSQEERHVTPSECMFVITTKCTTLKTQLNLSMEKVNRV